MHLITKKICTKMNKSIHFWNQENHMNSMVATDFGKIMQEMRKQDVGSKWTPLWSEWRINTQDGLGLWGYHDYKYMKSPSFPKLKSRRILYTEISICYRKHSSEKTKWYGRPGLVATRGMMQQCLSYLVESDYKSDFPMDVAPLSNASSCQDCITSFL